MNEFVNKKAVELKLDRAKVVKNIISPSIMQAKALDKGYFDTKLLTSKTNCTQST